MRAKIIIILLLNGCVLFSQNKKYVEFELVGSNGLSGFSLDSRIKKNPKFGYKVGIGYGFEFNDGASHWYFTPVKAYFPEDKRLNSVVSLPFNIHYLIGNEKNFLETGIGFCAFYADYKFGENQGLGYYTFGRIAYRHESLTKRILFSLGMDIPFKLPGSGLGYSLGIAPSLSIGYRL